MLINGEGTGARQKDNHEGLTKGSIQDFDDVIKQVYDEVETREISDGSGYTNIKGKTMTLVAQYLKPKFNIRPILKRLDEFKRLISKQLQEAKQESYAATQHNPASQTGEMMRPSKISGGKRNDVIKESAILIFAVDTSGSITEKDYEFIFGFLDRIEKHFAKPMKIRNDKGEKIGSLSGEVYLVEWDYGIHPPIRKWTQVKRGNMVKHVTPAKEERAKSNKLRGNGGTSINKMFAALDKLFYREINGKKYFDLDETADYINISRDVNDANDRKKQKKAKKFRVQLKKRKRKQIKEISLDRIEQDVDLTPGQPNFFEGRKKVANVPFLLIYTDGDFPPADYTISKLYADNPGNILYVLTKQYYLKNLRPVNVIFHDLHKTSE